MEFFAFLATLSIFFSIPPKKQKIFLTESIIFSLILILISYVIFFFDKTPFKENLWLLTLYALCFIIYTNSAIIKGERYFLLVIYALLFACLFNCFAILSQKIFITQDSISSWIASYSSTHGRPYGNFGQPNLAATFLIIGLCCGIYLQKKNKINKKTLLLLSIFLGLCLSAPSSKTAILTLAILITTSAILKKKIDFLVFSTAFITFLAGINFHHPTIQTTNRDLVGSDVSTGRFDLWMTMIDALAQSPWIGYGALNTRVAHFNSRELDIVPRNQVISSSHNIFLDLLIWFGCIAGLMLAVLLIKFTISYFRYNKNNEERLYLITPLLIHSLLEYPLFYANFLIIFALISSRYKKYTNTIQSKKLIYLLTFYFCLLFLFISTDYISVSNEYKELRFHLGNFKYSQKPAPIDIRLLDITGGQFNTLLIEKIENENQLNEIKNLTMHSTTIKNYSLIINYLKEKQNRDVEIAYWMQKAKSSFNSTQIATLEKIQNSNN